VKSKLLGKSCLRNSDNDNDNNIICVAPFR